MKSRIFYFIPVVALFFCAIIVTEVQAASWAKLMNNSAEYVMGVDYFDDDTGAILTRNSGSTELYVTVVDGAWEDREVYEPTSFELNDVEFLDRNTIIAVGESGTIVKTDDLGETWTDVSVTTSNDLNQIEIYDRHHMWAVGDSGEIYYSSDSGSFWTAQTSGVPEDLRGVYFIDESTGYIVGDNETVLYTPDAGTTWYIVRFGGTAEFYDAHYFSPTEGLVASSSGLLSTTDGGASWFAVAGVASTTMKAFDFSSSTGGAVVGTSAAYTTKDGGATWIESAIPDEDGLELLSDVVHFGSDIMIAGVTSYLKSILFVTDDDGPAAVTDLAADTPVADTIVAVSWTAAIDDYGIDYYEIDLDGDGYSDIGSVTEYELTVDEGVHTVSVRAVDFAGLAGDAQGIEVLSDATGPEVSAVSPISASVGSTTELSIAATDDLSDVDTCTLYINGVSQGAMTDSSGEFSLDYTFSVAGNYSAYALCSDTLANSTIGSASTITVGTAAEIVEAEEEASSSDESSDVVTDVSDLGPNTLVKSQCIGETDVNDPCRAVYYHDADGKRHAFPNSKVYFTWYDDFDDVVIVDAEVMAELSLGKNVTYHPGTKMVKFQTVNTVYAVELGGVLRAIGSEEVATDLYGSDWNQQIDDISDAFFSNYSFGDDIDSASDYDVDDAIASVSSLSDNF